MNADSEPTSPLRSQPSHGASAPWISVIMPSYRGEFWIATSLSSLVREAAEGVEVLVIDSGPTSAARDIAQSYSDRLRIRVFERCDLRSWQAKTNFGVEMAESSHICWLGVDDLWLPGRTGRFDPGLKPPRTPPSTWLRARSSIRVAESSACGNVRCPQTLHSDRLS